LFIPLIAMLELADYYGVAALARGCARRRRCA
jgi:hypothetical protein